VTVVEGEGLVPAREESRTERARFRAVPYYAWDHREPGEMRVWLDAA